MIDDAVCQLTEVLDLLSQLVDHQAVDQIQDLGSLRLLDHRSRVFNDLFGHPEELAVLGGLLFLPLLGGHPLDLLHAAAGAAGAIGKPGDPVGQLFVEILHQPGDHPHTVPQQGGIGGVMDIGFHHRGIDPEFFTILDSEVDGRLHHGAVDGLQGLGSQAEEGAVEGVVFGNGVAVKVREVAQGVSIVNAFAQLAIIPVLHPHEDQGAEGLRGVDAAASGERFPQAPLEILADHLDGLAMLLQQVGDGLQGSIEVEALVEELQIGEGALGVGGSHVFSVNSIPIAL